MRNAVRDCLNHHEAAWPGAGRTASTVARGGPVAALQQSIEKRIGALDLAAVVVPAPSASLAERLVEALSRAAGPVALGFAYGATALAWLG